MMGDSEFNIRDQLKKMRDKADQESANTPQDLAIHDDMVIGDDMLIGDDLLIGENERVSSDPAAPPLTGLNTANDDLLSDKRPTIKLTPELIDQINKLYDPAADYVYRPGEEQEKEESEAPIKLKLDLKRIGRDVWKRKHLILGIMLLVFITALFALTRIIQPKYQATVILLLKTEDSAINTTTEQAAHIKLQPYNVDTLANTMITITSLKHVVDTLHLSLSPWQMINNFKALAPKKTNTIELSITDTDPKRAALLVNTMADTAVSANKEIYINEANRYISYFEQKLENEKNALNAIREKIILYTRANNIVDVTAQTPIDLTRLSSLEVACEDTQLELATITQQIDSLRYLLNNDPDQLIEKMIDANPLKMELINLQSSLASAKTEYTDKNPKIQKLVRQIELLRSKVSIIAYNSALLELTHKKTAAELKLAQINSTKTTLREQLLALPEKQINYNTLTEERTQIETRLKHFQDLTDEARMVRESGMSNLQVASYAQTPESMPKQRVSPLVILAAFAFALFAGLGSTIIIILSSFKISTKKELELIFDLPVSIEIQQFPANQLEDLYNFDDGLYQDSFRKLLSKLNKANKKPVRSILVTSAEEGEGKTLVCYNLVKYLTKRSQNVLYLNLCPNNEIEDGLGIIPTENTVELTDFFMNNGLFAKLTQKTSKPGLFYVRTGDTWDKYLDAVESSQMQDFFNLLETQYEFVIIDCPAVLRAPDLPHLQKVADATVMVVESNLLSRSQIAQAIENMGHSRIRATCFVLNKINQELMSTS